PSEQGKATADSRYGPGLVVRVAAEKRALDMILDPLLESDSKPDNLIRAMERALFSDVVLLCAFIFWVFLFMVSLVALWKDHWFGRSMQLFLVAPSIAWILMVILTVRRDSMKSLNIDWVLTIQTTAEVLLFLVGLTSILIATVQGLEKENPNDAFMIHKKSIPLPLTVMTGRTASTVYHLALIALVGVVTSNVFLLPLYMAQLSFPGLFAGMLGGLLLILSVFYVVAYRRVSPDAVPVSAGIAFLGHRMISNTYFIAAIVLIVVLVLGSVVLIARLNVEVLQRIGVLAAPGNL
ncbi:MAG: hypothetical protein HY042_10130, partial [Spirochaetia bacterium]|nr:hypothetical protein [Spirochaetia bacterium]